MEMMEHLFTVAGILQLNHPLPVWVTLVVSGVVGHFVGKRASGK